VIEESDLFDFIVNSISSSERDLGTDRRMDGRFVFVACSVSKDKPMTDDRARFFVTAHQTSISASAAAASTQHILLFFNRGKQYNNNLSCLERDASPRESICL